MYGYIKFCAQLSTARRKAPRNLAWCGRGSNPGPLARRCQQSHDTHVGLSSYRLRHRSLGQKSYSEWHILWDGDNLCSSGLREEREVYLAQAVMIFVWSGTRLNTSLGSPRYDLSVWGYSVNWFHDTTRHADTFCFCEDMAGEILRIIVALPVLFSTGSITIIRRCASIVKAPVSRWWCSAQHASAIPAPCITTRPFATFSTNQTRWHTQLRWKLSATFQSCAFICIEGASCLGNTL